MRSEQWITTSGGLKLYSESLVPDDPVAFVLFVHGVSDYSGRYIHVFQYLADHGYGVMWFDLRGFGRSEGLPGYVNHFDEYVDDMAATSGEILRRAGAKPVFVLAHSMGALVAARYILRGNQPFRGVVYTSGLFKVNEDISPILQRLSSFLSRIAPRLKTIKLDANALSRDPAVFERTRIDPLHYIDGLRVRTGAEMIRATAETQTRLDQLDHPMLILHGSADLLTRPEASELLYSRSTSGDKTLKIYEDAFHELLNEVNKEEVFTDIYNWITVRL